MTGIALIGVALFVQLSTTPIEGHWVANLAKSKLSPAFPFHSPTLDVVVKGDAVSFTDKVVTAPGKEEGHSNLTSSLTARSMRSKARHSAPALSLKRHG
jgi:hypothetical protein